ncbi:hypothetical protein PPERSA_05318 [Pseudocohnilembus persalinus]|uniref:Uncharacterized protein n=1 Tax=Pseudocohnilembus persalinus TaxID=266149 RepID=A0A0V0R5Y8_PSEPJ|nr:hypothetical protein PPERSA_05318 [Pseudocohnilembus persalinus]|eukprot:KRX09926.1 hypothetical protein PPERSA_05318 [Pseudocohnilembus persalinus]
MNQDSKDLKKILQKEEEAQMKRFLMHKKLNKYQENKNFQNIQKKIQVIKQDQDYLDKVGLKHKIYLSNPQKDEKEMRQAILINKMQQDSKKDSFRQMQRNSLRIQQQILVSQGQLEKIYKNKKLIDKNKVYNIKLEDQSFQNNQCSKNFNMDIENDQQNQKFLQFLDNDKKNIDISIDMQIMNFQGQRSTKRIFNDIQLVQTPLMEETIQNNRIFLKKTNIYKEFLGLSKNVDEEQNQLKDKFQKFYQNNKIFKTGSQDENQNQKEEDIFQSNINSDKNIADKVLERQFSKTSNFTMNSLQQRLKQQEKEKERIQRAQYQKEKIQKAEQKQKELLELQKQQILTIGHIGVQFSEDPSDQEEENEIFEQEMQKKRKSYAQWMLESKGFNNNHNNNKGSKFGRKLKSQQSQLSSKKSLTDRNILKKGVQMGTSGQLDYKKNQFSQVKGLEKASSLVVQKGFYDSASKKKQDMSVPYKQQSRKEMLQDKIADNERLQLLEKDCSIEQSLDIVENDRKISEGILKQLKGMTSDTNLDKTLENLVEKQSFHKNLLGQEIDEQNIQLQKLQSKDGFLSDRLNETENLQTSFDFIKESENLSQKKKSESLQSKLDQNFENINQRFVKMCKNLNQEEFQKKQIKY